VVEMARRK
jgi:hypothetical protein